MKELQELVPDAEIFRRVWQRVMPDQELSQIVIRPPAQGRPAPPGPKPEKPGEADITAQLLRMLSEGLGTVEELRRRRPDTWPLGESLRKSAARVRSDWFLHTGRRWELRPTRPPKGLDPGQLLRRQYLWELDFSRECRRLDRDGADGEELAQALAEESAGRRRLIRRLLTGHP